MDSIKKAMELARARRAELSGAGIRLPPPVNRELPKVPPKPALVGSGPVVAAKPPLAVGRAPFAPRPRAPSAAVVNLDLDHLEEMRIVAHNSSNHMASSFDVLRTKVLQEMDAQKWHTVLITSPSPGCGKSVTAINLAFSIARQEGRDVILVDMDLRKPTVAEYLGIKSIARGLDLIVKGEASPTSCVMQVSAGGTNIGVLASGTPVRHPAEFIASSRMKALLDELKAMARTPVIVIDSSPMLVSDDVLALLPQVDCVVMAVAEKISTFPEVETCERSLNGSNYLGMVLTKSHEKLGSYYAYY